MIYTNDKYTVAVLGGCKDFFENIEPSDDINYVFVENELDIDKLNIQGVMYSIDERQNDPNVSKYLYNILSKQGSTSDLHLYPIVGKDHKSEGRENVDINETNYINDSYSQLGIFGDSVTVYPAAIFEKNDLSQYIEIYIKGLAKEYNLTYDEFKEEHRQTYDDLVNTLLKVIEDKDEYTKGHVTRVLLYSVELGKEFNFSEEELQELKTAALFHDIGKCVTPGEIISSKERLTDSQFPIMKKHDKFGKHILEMLVDNNPKIKEHFPQRVLDAIGNHHVRYDQNPNINKYTKVISIVDSLDAMKTQRPYNMPKNILDVFRDIYLNKDAQFDGEVADALLILLAKQLGSMGYDVVSLFQNIEKVENIDELLENKEKYINDRSCEKEQTAIADYKLLEFFEKHADEIIVETGENKKEICDMGFSVDDSFYFVFHGENAPNRTKTNPEKEAEGKKALAYSLLPRNDRMKYTVKMLKSMMFSYNLDMLKETIYDVKNAFMIEQRGPFTSLRYQGNETAR